EPIIPEGPLRDSVFNGFTTPAAVPLSHDDDRRAACKAGSVSSVQAASRGRVLQYRSKRRSCLAIAQTMRARLGARTPAQLQRAVEAVDEASAAGARGGAFAQASVARALERFERRLAEHLVGQRDDDRIEDRPV